MVRDEFVNEDWLETKTTLDLSPVKPSLSMKTGPQTDRNNVTNSFILLVDI